MEYRVKGRIQGFVQGVGYRFFIKQLADEMKINGWARNIDDGSVELCLKGRREDVNELQHKASIGPAGADVQSVSWSFVTDIDANDFTIG